MPIVCQEFFFVIGEGDREERERAEKYLVYRVGIRMKFTTTKKFPFK
jgi:hypothetical protein